MESQAGGSGVLLWMVLGIMIGIVLGFLLSLAFRKSKIEPERLAQTESPLQLQNQPAPVPARRALSHARRCPVCNSTYTDEALIYCVSDGASLVTVINSSSEPDPGATVLYGEAGNRDVPPTVPARPDENQR